MKRQLRLFNREFFGENNELLISSRIILFFLAGIIDAAIMCVIEPPNASDAPAVFVVAIMIGIAGSIVFLPIAALARKYLPSQVLVWPSIAAYISLCTFFALFTLGEGADIYEAMRWVETFAFLHIPSFAYIALESIFYILGAHNRPQTHSDILDDL